MYKRFVFGSVAAVCLVAFISTVRPSAQFGDPDRVIPGGGIHAQGWTGQIDSGSAAQGRVLNDARVDENGQNGQAFHITTGPAATFWNPANMASGDYSVKATFLEPKFMELNSHPHSYGLFIGGNKMGTADMSLALLRHVHGNGSLLVRGFGPAVFTRWLRRGRMRRSTRRRPSDSRSRTWKIMWSW